MEIITNDAWLNKSWNILIDEGSCVTKVDFKIGYFSKRSLFMQNQYTITGLLHKIVKFNLCYLKIQS